MYIFDWRLIISHTIIHICTRCSSLLQFVRRHFQVRLLIYCLLIAESLLSLLLNHAKKCQTTKQLELMSPERTSRQGLSDEEAPEPKIAPESRRVKTLLMYANFVQYTRTCYTAIIPHNIQFCFFVLQSNCRYCALDSSIMQLFVSI